MKDNYGEIKVDIPVDTRPQTQQAQETQQPQRSQCPWVQNRNRPHCPWRSGMNCNRRNSPPFPLAHVINTIGNFMGTPSTCDGKQEDKKVAEVPKKEDVITESNIQETAPETEIFEENVQKPAKVSDNDETTPLITESQTTAPTQAETKQEEAPKTETPPQNLVFETLFKKASEEFSKAFSNPQQNCPLNSESNSPMNMMQMFANRFRSFISEVKQTKEEKKAQQESQMTEEKQEQEAPIDIDIDIEPKCLNLNAPEFVPNRVEQQGLNLNASEFVPEGVEKPKTQAPQQPELDKATLDKIKNLCEIFPHIPRLTIETVVKDHKNLGIGELVDHFVNWFGGW